MYVGIKKMLPPLVSNPTYKLESYLQAVLDFLLVPRKILHV
jgi:hypothetical protein